MHCYAGQSRSAAFVIAYLIGRQGMSLVEAWGAVAMLGRVLSPMQVSCVN